MKTIAVNSNAEKLLGTKDCYLTVEMIEEGTVTLLDMTNSPVNELYYSINDGDWQVRDKETDTQDLEISVEAGDKIHFKSVLTGTQYGSLNNMVGISGNFKLKGVALSLILGDDFLIKTFKPSEEENYQLKGLFSGMVNLVDASDLILPTDLFNTCFYEMFKGCTSLISAPELPATTLAKGCYTGMFNGCTSLTTAPELPATTLESTCYLAMFNDCTSLTVAPELPAMTMAEQCYSEMFSNSGLTSAPYLPATTLATKCYNFMFSGCYSLTYSPTLPATTMAEQCYRGMFASCTHLVTAPKILGTTLQFGCYWSMFQGCTLLTEPPALPVTTLANNCYIAMFQNCKALTTAPELPAITLAENCYNNLFNGCTDLNYIKAMFTTTPSNSYSYNWVKSVAASGTFVKNSAAEWTTTGIHGVPTGWTVETYEEQPVEAK